MQLLILDSAHCNLFYRKLCSELYKNVSFCCARILHCVVMEMLALELFFVICLSRVELSIQVVPGNTSIKDCMV